MNTPRKEVIEVAERLEKLIQDGINSATRQSVGLHKDRYNALKELITDTLTDAENLHDNMSEEGLTFNAIESEGALRMARLMASHIETAERWYPAEILEC